jgi:hypothetical protein
MPATGVNVPLKSRSMEKPDIKPERKVKIAKMISIKERSQNPLLEHAPD